MGGTSRPTPAVVKSPNSLPRVLPDAVSTDETWTSQVAEFKVSPPSRKRKMTIEFPDDYGSVNTLTYKLWPKVDRLWVPASRERQEALSSVATTAENVSKAWKIDLFNSLCVVSYCSLF